MPVDPYARPLDALEPGGDTPEAKAARKAYFGRRDRDVSQVGGGEQLTISPENYTVVQPADYIDNARRADAVAGRQGVRADFSKADAALAQSLAARARQQEGAQLYGATAMGLSPSAAQEQMRMALDAQTQAAARQGGARGIQASTGGYGQSTAMGAAGRQQETQAGFRGAAQSLNSMRTGDIQTMRGSQDAAFAQAQLEAAQRARNDELGRAYASERTNYGIEQLGADQSYEAQRNFNLIAARQQEEARRRLQNEKDMAIAGAAMGAASMGFAQMGKK